MKDNKKKIYFRLAEDFFDRPEIKVVESMTDGYLYSNILLKMNLMSLETGGKLVVNRDVPINTETLAVLTNHEIGTVEKAITIFQDLGLIKILGDGTICTCNSDYVETEE